MTWTFEKEFDESILLWHIATDLCFHIHGLVVIEQIHVDETGQGVGGQIHDENGKCKICQGVVEHINGNANEN